MGSGEELGLEQMFKSRGFWVEESELRIGRQVGKGAAGHTYLGLYRNERVAVKMYSNEMLDHDTLSVINEMRFMLELNHENICPFIGIVWKHTPRKVMLLSTYAVNGDLQQAIHEKKIIRKLSFEHKIKLAMGIARGLEHIHSFEIIHRDVKCANVLLDANLTPWLTDFGFSRFVDRTNTMTGETGSYRYMAPEVIRASRYSAKADIYSYAVVLNELFTEEQPFFGMHPYAAARNVARRGIRPSMDKLPHPTLNKLIRACWQEDENRRPEWFLIRGVLKEILDDYLSARGLRRSLPEEQANAKKAVPTAAAQQAAAPTTTRTPNKVAAPNVNDLPLPAPNANVGAVAAAPVLPRAANEAAPNPALARAPLTEKFTRDARANSADDESRMQQVAERPPPAPAAHERDLMNTPTSTAAVPTAPVTAAVPTAAVPTTPVPTTPVPTTPVRTAPVPIAAMPTMAVPTAAVSSAVQVPTSNVPGEQQEQPIALRQPTKISADEDSAPFWMTKSRSIPSQRSSNSGLNESSTGAPHAVLETPGSHVRRSNPRLHRGSRSGSQSNQRAGETDALTASVVSDSYNQKSSPASSPRHSDLDRKGLNGGVADRRSSSGSNSRSKGRADQYDVQEIMMNALPNGRRQDGDMAENVRSPSCTSNNEVRSNAASRATDPKSIVTPTSMSFGESDRDEEIDEEDESNYVEIQEVAAPPFPPPAQVTAGSGTETDVNAKTAAAAPAPFQPTEATAPNLASESPLKSPAAATPPAQSQRRSLRASLQMRSAKRESLRRERAVADAKLDGHSQGMNADTGRRPRACCW